MRATLKLRAAGVKKSGVVNVIIHPQEGQKHTVGRVIEAVQAGLPFHELQTLQVSLKMPLEQLASKLRISRATLHRRRAQGRLDQQESDRVIRFAQLMAKAVEVFESEDAARRWLNSPQLGLGGATPLDYAETEIGAREVDDLLGRIDFGVYS